MKAGRKSMAQRRRVSNTPYIYDNTARDLQIRRQMEEPRRQMSHETRKNREKARHMSIGYVTFLMGALIACAAFLVNSKSLTESNATTCSKSRSCIRFLITNFLLIPFLTPRVYSRPVLWRSAQRLRRFFSS